MSNQRLYFNRMQVDIVHKLLLYDDAIASNIINMRQNYILIKVKFVAVLFLMCTLHNQSHELMYLRIHTLWHTHLI